MGRSTQGAARPPGMMDVAKVAGVSHQTVSRVLNKHPHVLPATRDRVLKAMADLGYRRNSAARALVTRRSQTIGVITMATTLYGPTSTWLSVESAAREAGYFVSAASLAVVDAPHISATLDHFMDQGVEGVVLIAPRRSVVKVAQTFAPSVPVVVVADVTKDIGFHTVGVDQEAGVRLALDHLFELGHRDIVHIAGPQDFFDGSARLRSWKRFMAAKHLTIRPPLIGDWSAESGYELGRQAIADGLPDAFFMGNDPMALGLLQALYEAGISVPAEISVVGFDDVQETAFYRPALTTIRQDFAKVGRSCIEVLLRMLSDVATPPSVPITPQLIIRSSTAAVRSSALWMQAGR